ncbi:Aste57867_21314 [Aphanomyces stellatus]|uniref:Aste57867_21314 protein n=1 Tax=Aphanomyces stellatus TaxID=120398 RepID=A0A485LIH1_9STRA|nr:hypothetical protein As57867_021245 [Aphanomyces stellatus]VFT97986.1 Aste57867_21314 [Aphanomyces stellatus]
MIQPTAYSSAPLPLDGDLLSFIDDTISLFPSKEATTHATTRSAASSCQSSPRSATDHDHSDDGGSCSSSSTTTAAVTLEKGEKRKQQIREASRRCRIKQRTEVMFLRARVMELEAQCNSTNPNDPGQLVVDRRAVAAAQQLQQQEQRIAELEQANAALTQQLSENQQLLATIRELVKLQ